MGYCGGAQLDPTYHDLGDHTEAFQVDFDPARVTYAQLAELFWGSHDPTARRWNTQYKSALWFDGPEQEKTAFATRDAVAAKLGKSVQTVQTEILPLPRFYLAEDYHQKYALRHDDLLMKELERWFGDDPLAFANSSTAMRLNAWLAGHAPVEQVEHDLPLLGLSDEAQAHVRQRISRPAPGCR